MIFAYLILAHDNAAQLSALLDRLLTPDNEDFVVVHLDAKSALGRDGAKAIRDHAAGRVKLIEAPVSVRWGHASQLDATLALLDSARKCRFDAAHLISGADWPVAARSRIVDALAESPLACRIDASGCAQGERMQRYWLHDRFLNARIERGVAARAVAKGLKSAGRLADRTLGPRRLAYGAPWRKGSQWWSLPHDACDVVATDLEAFRRAGRLRFTACSDEHVIQTIVAHRFPDRLADNRRFMRWSTDSSPALLGENDAESIAASGAWFARKVDMRVDPWFLTAYPRFA